MGCGCGKTFTRRTPAMTPSMLKTLSLSAGSTARPLTQPPTRQLTPSSAGTAAVQPQQVIQSQALAQRRTATRRQV